jgi:hypothetical protein
MASMKIKTLTKEQMKGLFTKVILDGEKIVAENLETTDYKGIKE